MLQLMNLKDHWKEGQEPYGITFDSANNNIYVTNSVDRTVSIITTIQPLTPIQTT
jgi:DNA-binding beta-propeller fold protein YncE